jgi:hypothetical protein
MKRKYIAGIVAISTVLLALILKEFVADKIITPIWKFITIFDDMPQALLWFFSIGLLMLLEWKSFGRWSIPWFKSRKKEIIQKGRIETLADLIQKARNRKYFKKQLARHLADLTFDVFANNKGSTTRTMKEHFDDGSLELPPEIRGYFKAGFKRIEIYTGKTKKKDKQYDDYAIQLDPLEVIEFIERQLEVDYGRKERT